VRRRNRPEPVPQMPQVPVVTEADDATPSAPVQIS
jgi:hypothetical protein